MFVLFVASLFAIALSQDPTPPTGFPDKFYSWVVVSVTKQGVDKPVLSQGQLIAYDASKQYSCRYQEQNLVNGTNTRPSDYCDGATGYHYTVTDATGVFSPNPPCTNSTKLPEALVSPQYPKDFLSTAKYLGVVKVNQKSCYHFYAPSVYGGGMVEFQMDLFSDADGFPCQISIQNKDDSSILTWAFDGFSQNIPPNTPCDVPLLLCGERSYTCQANPKAKKSDLESALGWVCGVQDCSPINPGGAHYYPNTLEAHCTWAFTNYYINNRLQQGSGACNFNGNAILAPPTNSSRLEVNHKRNVGIDVPTLFPLYVVCSRDE